MWPCQVEILTLSFLPLTADLPLWAKPPPTTGGKEMGKPLCRQAEPREEGPELSMLSEVK